MTTAVITSKGQVTIPVDVRRRLGLDSGDRIEFVELETGGFAIRTAIGDVRSLKGLLGKPSEPVSVEDMNQAILARAESSNRR